MPTITPDEAREKFGELLHAPTRTYREFEEEGEGIWRPIYVDGGMAGYRLQRLHKLTKKLPKWRPRRK